MAVTASSGTTPDFVRRVIDVARGAAGAAPEDWEHRAFKRRRCDGWIALVHFDADGRRTPAMPMRAEDIGVGGLAVYSWTELPVGARGAVLMKSGDGPPEILGVKVAWCRRRGELDWQCGLRFAERPRAVTLDDFREPDGQLMELGPALTAA